MKNNFLKKYGLVVFLLVHFSMGLWAQNNPFEKEIIAFANTKGGLLFFGIDDDGSIYGVDSEKEISELVNETIDEYCEPIIEYKINFINLF